MRNARIAHADFGTVREVEDEDVLHARFCIMLDSRRSVEFPG